MKRQQGCHTHVSSMFKVHIPLEVVQGHLWNVNIITHRPYAQRRIQLPDEDDNPLLTYSNSVAILLQSVIQESPIRYRCRTSSSDEGRQRSTLKGHESTAAQMFPLQKVQPGSLATIEPSRSHARRSRFLSCSPYLWSAVISHVCTPRTCFMLSEAPAAHDTLMRLPHSLWAQPFAGSCSKQGHLLHRSTSASQCAHFVTSPLHLEMRGSQYLSGGDVPRRTASVPGGVQTSVDRVLDLGRDMNRNAPSRYTAKLTMILLLALSC